MAAYVSEDEEPIRFAFRAVEEQEYEPVVVALEDDIKTYTNANKLSGIPPWKDVQEHFASDVSCLHWLLDEKILTPPTHCPDCNTELGPCNDKGLLRCFECRRRTGLEWSQSVYHGTFFEGFYGGRHLLMMFLYHWLCGAPAGFQRKTQGWSNRKVANWNKNVQDMIACCVTSDEYDSAIGGEGIVVQVDETLAGKCKYHRGHPVQGSWVFGGVECTPQRKFFALIVEHRDKATLLPLIKKFIKPGSIIVSDCWKGYRGIDRIEGGNYTHETVNHSRGYLNPENGACTNTIEGTWAAMKATIPMRRRNRKQLQSCIFEFIWRRANEGNLWNGLLAALRDVRYKEDDEEEESDGEESDSESSGDEE